MEIETLEIFQYVSQCEPIAKLSEQQRKALISTIEIQYAKRGTSILNPGDTNEYLYLIRSGAVERQEQNGQIVAQFSETDFFGQASLQRKGEVKRQVKALEDTLLYLIPASIFFELFETEPYFKYYFDRSTIKNTTDNFQLNAKGSQLNYTPVKSLLQDNIQYIDHKTTVGKCAQIMRQTGCTSLLITNNDDVKGIVTDRAFCTKVVAEGLSHESPVGLIMSEGLLTINADSTASEALMKMARFNVRHLPVLSNKKYIGVLTATDLIHRQSNNPIYLINKIFNTNTIEGLVKASDQIPVTLTQMVEQGLDASDISYTISSIGRAINRQLLKMAEEQLGEPPVEYAWVIAGSLARNDQTAKSDQDNMLLLADDYDADLHDDYFQSLCQFVCDGLNACGYVYCPGDVMAINPKWRQPLDVWKTYFDSWILKPEPKALMYASIFFDLRSIHGTQSLLTQLQEYVNKLVKTQPMFLNYMAANALHHTPPLGLFRSFVLEDHGSEKKALNMKKRGVVPITDLARVYALACGCYPINTIDRLEAACESGALSQPGLHDLKDAFVFLSNIRVQHQAKQISQGIDADNYLAPETLSSLEKRHLKDTFETVRTYQSAMSTRYQTGRLN
ncbi:cyclic nucleotide-binding/CBS domain-containing protein [Aliikangiella marina]|uniref:Cyclic nucleotide-binding/CBS domain-containing protein n=1 Tax=Aliikangiella marina TaxID=1712262 RepID=A0A545THW9_9GAMM|nr:putative nucleotidyltransferase substrate binding domain-containing protein [Aliikangiella marina]TQV76786.1 cyclic nucleotide-binding/CBS domain-containing protein [Aliikangiella marina]